MPFNIREMADRAAAINKEDFIKKFIAEISCGEPRLTEILEPGRIREMAEEAYRRQQSLESKIREEADRAAAIMTGGAAIGGGGAAGGDATRVMSESIQSRIGELTALGYDAKTALALAKAEFKHALSPGNKSTPKTYTKEEVQAGSPQWEIILEQTAKARELANRPFIPYHRSVRESLARNPAIDAEMRRLETLRTSRPDIYERYGPALERKLNQDISAEIAGHLPTDAKFAERRAASLERNDRYLRNMTKALSDEYREHWEEKELPTITAGYGARNLHYSSARQKTEEKAKKERQKSLEREIAKLTYAASKDADAVAHSLGEQGLKTADSLTRAKAADKESTVALARSASDLATGNQARDEIDRAAVMQLAEHKKAEEQALLNEERRRFEEARDYAKHQLEFETGISRGMRIPTASFTPMTPTPAPPTAPNPYTAAAGFMQQMAGLGGAGKASGGSVRAKRSKGGAVRLAYAEGGSTPFVNYADAQLPAFNTPEMNEIRQLANEVRNSTQSPGIDWMAAGMRTLANVRSPHPMAAIADSITHGRDVYAKTLEAHNKNRLRTAGILNSINKSRLDQQKIINEARENKEKLAEQARMHSSQIDLNAAHADYYRRQTREQELKNRMYEPNESGEPSEMQLDAPTKPMTASREKSIREADNAIAANIAIINSALSAAQKFHKVSTGRITGGISSIPYVGSDIAGFFTGQSADDWADAESEGNKLLSDLANYEKNTGRSVAHLNLARSGKAGTTQTPQYNKNFTLGKADQFIEATKKEIEHKKMSGASMRSIMDSVKQLEEVKKAYDETKKFLMSPAERIEAINKRIAEKEQSMYGG